MVELWTVHWFAQPLLAPPLSLSYQQVHLTTGISVESEKTSFVLHEHKWYTCLLAHTSGRRGPITQSHSKARSEWRNTKSCLLVIRSGQMFILGVNRTWDPITQTTFRGGLRHFLLAVRLCLEPGFVFTDGSNVLNWVGLRHTFH